MRVTVLVATAWVLALAGSALAQDDWTEFVSRDDGFRIAFPGTPKVQQIAWTSLVVTDGWSVEQAGAEAATIGLVNDDPSVPALWKFAQDYINAHIRT